MRTGIGLPARRDVGMPGDCLQRETLSQSGDQGFQCCVLRFRKSSEVVALEFDTKREIVATLPAVPARSTCMPGSLVTGDKLDEMAIATDEEVRRNAPVGDGGEVGMGRWIKPIGKQLNHGVTAILPRWQADGVNDEEAGYFISGAGIVVGAWNSLNAAQPA